MKYVRIGRGLFLPIGGLWDLSLLDDKNGVYWAWDQIFVVSLMNSSSIGALWSFTNCHLFDVWQFDFVYLSSDIGSNLTVSFHVLFKKTNVPPGLTGCAVYPSHEGRRLVRRSWHCQYLETILCYYSLRATVRIHGFLKNSTRYNFNVQRWEHILLHDLVCLVRRVCLGKSHKTTL